MPDAEHAEFILLCNPFFYYGKLFRVTAMICRVLRRICCRSDVPLILPQNFWDAMKILSEGNNEATAYKKSGIEMSGQSVAYPWSQALNKFLGE